MVWEYHISPPGASYFFVTKRGQIFMTSLSPIHDVMVTNLRLRIFSKSSQLNENKKLIIIIFSSLIIIMFRSYSAYHIQMASLCARGIITPALALMQPFSAKSIRRNKFLLGTHLHLRVERDNCGQNALSKGVRTEWDSNPRPSDCKSRARTTTPQC